MKFTLLVLVFMTVISASEKDGKDFVPPAITGHMLF